MKVQYFENKTRKCKIPDPLCEKSSDDDENLKIIVLFFFSKLKNYRESCNCSDNRTIRRIINRNQAILSDRGQVRQKQQTEMKIESKKLKL